MKTENWLEQKYNKYKDTFEYRFEEHVYNLTEKICEKMEENNINRTALSNRLNVSPAAITKILSGRSNFTLKSLLSLADSMDLDLKIDFDDKESRQYTMIREALSAGAMEIQFGSKIWSYLDSGAADVCIDPGTSTSFFASDPPEPAGTVPAGICKPIDEEAQSA